MTVKVAAIEYTKALDALSRESLNEMLSPVEIAAMLCNPDVIANMRVLRANAVKEYAASLLADERQQITERLAGWGFPEERIRALLERWR